MDGSSPDQKEPHPLSRRRFIRLAAGAAAGIAAAGLAAYEASKLFSPPPTETAKPNADKAADRGAEIESDYRYYAAAVILFPEDFKDTPLKVLPKAA